jgi:hypothetical protein
MPINLFLMYFFICKFNNDHITNSLTNKIDIIHDKFSNE